MATQLNYYITNESNANKIVENCEFQENYISTPPKQQENVNFLCSGPFINKVKP